VYRSQHIPELNLLGGQISQFAGGIGQRQASPATLPSKFEAGVAAPADIVGAIKAAVLLAVLNARVS